MNAKEMEALIIAQGAHLQAAERGLESAWTVIKEQRGLIDGLRDAYDSQVILNQGYDQVIAFQGEKIVQLSTANDEAWIMVKQRLSAFEEQFTMLTTGLGTMSERIAEQRDHQDGMNDTLFGATTRIEKLETLVLARNASAATKRNMTDEDALRVLTGDLRETSHKEAAEKIGLTYAQVYSCRLEFTFKHVHKDLRDNVKGWKNVWAK